MAHNSYPAGRSGSAVQWPDGSTVTPDEFAWLAACAFKSINGDDGGTWAPANVITIGGAGVAFSVATTLDSITVTGHSSLNTVGVSDYVGITGNLSAGGAIAFTGGSSGTHQTLLIGQYVDSTINGSLAMVGAATFTGNVALSGTGSRSFEIGADYTNTIRGTTAIYGFNVPAGELILCDSEARFAGGIRQPIETFTSNGTITGGTRYAVGNITGTGAVTLPASHPVNAPIEIVNISQDALSVLAPGGTSLFQLAGISGTGAAEDRAYAIVYYTGSAWALLRWYGRLA